MPPWLRRCAWERALTWLRARQSQMMFRPTRWPLAAAARSPKRPGPAAAGTNWPNPRPESKHKERGPERRKFCAHYLQARPSELKDVLIEETVLVYVHMHSSFRTRSTSARFHQRASRGEEPCVFRKQAQGPSGLLPPQPRDSGAVGDPRLAG